MDATLKFTFDDGTEALAHYGVLGMRWGVRHDDKYKSQKADIKEKVKAQVKSGQMTRKEGTASRRMQLNKAKVDTANRLYSMNSKETNKRIQTRSTAKTLGLSSVLGSYGTLHYDRAKSEGKSTGRAAVRGVLARDLNYATGGFAGLANYGHDRAVRQLKDPSGERNKSYLKGPGYENAQGDQPKRKRFNS